MTATPLNPAPSTPPSVSKPAGEQPQDGGVEGSHLGFEQRQRAHHGGERQQPRTQPEDQPLHNEGPPNHAGLGPDQLHVSDQEATGKHRQTDGVVQQRQGHQQAHHADRGKRWEPRVQGVVDALQEPLVPHHFRHPGDDLKPGCGLGQGGRLGMVWPDHHVDDGRERHVSEEFDEGFAELLFQLGRRRCGVEVRRLRHG